MASLYRRIGSRYWWIQYRGAGKIVRESTKLRTDSIDDTRKAQVLCSQKTTIELEHRKGSDEERFDAWVPDWLSLHYPHPLPKRIYSASWNALRCYLATRNVEFPRQLTHQIVVGYLAYRENGDVERGLRPAKRNSCLKDIGLLGRIMRQAMRLGYASENPASRLGISHTAPKEKPLFTPEQIALVREKLKDKPEWMRTSFEISLYTGCRLSDTRIAMERVDLVGRRIHFDCPKGGVMRAFTVPMRDELVPLFQTLQNRSWTLEWPAKRVPSSEWCRFFKQIGLPRHCFHCLRVTFVSAGAKAGVPERDMMRLVNHASTAVHRIYQRYAVEDLRDSLQRLKLP